MPTKIRIEEEVLRPPAAPGGRRVTHSPRGLEKLDRIAVRIFELNLPAAGTRFHRVAQMQPGSPERLDACRKVGHAEDDSIPSTGLLPPAVGHAA